MPTKALLTLLMKNLLSPDIGDETLGDGLRIVRLRKEDLKRIHAQNDKHVDSWDLFHGGGGHTYAALNEYDAELKTDEEAAQEIARAFVTLRIIKPLSLAWHLVVRAEGTDPNTRYELETRLGFGSVYYVSQSQIDNQLTPDDIRRARLLWPNVQHVFRNWRRYKRLVETVRMFEDAQAIPFTRRRHVLFHAGLEYLLCTNSQYIGQQLKQRIPAICPGVNRTDVGLITRMRAGLVHSGKVSEELAGREAEIEDKLERILRTCLFHVFASTSELEVFAGEETLKQKYPVSVEERVSTPTSRTIRL